MKRFPAKILLFGEYGLLYGAKALALPYHLFGGQLVKGSKKADSSSKEYESYIEIDRFVSFFDFHELNKELFFPLELVRLKEDLKNGLYFDSNIPLQYGVGSSGALCAALFDEYSIYHKEFKKISRNKDLLETLKKDFSVMERYFHRSSSGIDPMVSFLGRPLLFDNGHVSFVEFPSTSEYSIYLIDTGQKSPTGPLVDLFKQKMEDQSTAEQFANNYLPVNDEVVEALTEGNSDMFLDGLRKLSEMQLDYFSAMIPVEFADKIRTMHKQGVFVKLLGSGGGGYLLAFVPKGKQLDISTPHFKLEDSRS